MIKKSQRINISNLSVDNLSLSQTISAIEEMIASKKPHQHVVVNMNKLLQAHNNDEFADIIKDCDIINADGISVIWLSKVLGTPLKERITGIDLMNQLIRLSEDKGYSVYFLGAKEDVLEKVIQIYKSIHPKLKIAGFRNGYWDSKGERRVIENIRAAGPDILFVGMSSPKKEYFLHKYLGDMGVPFVMGVGGTFDVIAGVAKRAPLWMQNLGLEWFFRFVQEPRRLWRRYLIGNLMFLRFLLEATAKRIAR